MIDITGCVVIDVPIDVITPVQDKNVNRTFVIIRTGCAKIPVGTAISLSLGDPFTNILNDPGPFGNVSAGENSKSMNGGMFFDDKRTMCWGSHRSVALEPMVRMIPNYWAVQKFLSDLTDYFLLDDGVPGLRSNRY